MDACSAHAQVGILAMSHILPYFNSFAAFLKYTQKTKTNEGYLNSFPIEKKNPNKVNLYLIQLPICNSAKCKMKFKGFDTVYHQMLQAMKFALLFCAI